MHSIKAKIYILREPYKLFLEEEIINIDELFDQEFIAETIYTAISPGTETGAYIGLSSLRPGNPYPRIMGYCNIAKIIYIGTKVKDVKIGDHILTFQSHRSAFKCHVNDFYIKILDESNLKFITTSYLYHLGYHSLLTAYVRQGYNVGIIGAGTLGYTSSIMSSLAGVKTFLFTNQKEVSSLLLNKDVFCLQKSEHEIGIMTDLTHQIGLDVIVNTSNTWDDWILALKIVRKGGMIVNLGFPGRGQELPGFNPLDPQYVYVKNLTIKALCFINEGDVPAYEIRFNMKNNLMFIIDLISKGKINAPELITHEIYYTQLQNQYKNYAKRNNFMLSTLINWKD